MVPNRATHHNLLVNIFKMAYMKVFQFSLAVRGYHYYKKFWNPQKDQLLECFHGNQNPFDRFAIKVYEVWKENPVGYLP